MTTSTTHPKSLENNEGPKGTHKVLDVGNQENPGQDSPHASTPEQPAETTPTEPLQDAQQGKEKAENFAEFSPKASAVDYELDVPPSATPDPETENENTLSTEEILTRIETLATGFNQRSQAHEETIRKMHRRIEELQEDQVRTLLKPVFERLAGLHAQSDEGAEQARSGTLNQSNTIKILEQFKDSIEDLLSMLDVESVEATIGETVDRKKHYAVKTKKTGNKSLDKTIYKVQRQGFTFVGAERVMLPARVIAYKYDASLDTPEAPQPESLTSDKTPTVPLDTFNTLEK